MITISSTPGAVKKFKRTPWRFQQTVEIPAGNELGKFVSSILTAHPDINEAVLVIKEIIFNTGRMGTLFDAAMPAKFSIDSCISAGTRQEVEQLLGAAFHDGNEFIVIPVPKPFVLYADHDGWVTFYANTKSNLNHVIEPLRSDGFKLVKDWVREL